MLDPRIIMRWPCSSCCPREAHTPRSLLGPPGKVDTYRDTARPRLARSRPPELANREKLLRGDVNRLGLGTMGGLFCDSELGVSGAPST
jgi:hypothetical protein